MPKNIVREQNTTKQRRTIAAAPAYQRVSDDLRAKVADGYWASGAMLPSRKDLAQKYAVSLNTMERAISDLLADGTLRADYGRGTFVADNIKADPMRLKQDASDGPIATDPDMSDFGSRTHEPVAGRPPAKATIGIISRLQPEAYRQGIRDRFAEVITNSLERSITNMGGITRFFNLYRPDETVATPAEAISALLEEGVDGIVFIYASLSNELIQLPAAIRSTTPLVFIGSARSIHPSLTVYYDSQDAGYQAVYHLLENGITDLMYFAPYTIRWSQEREEGARQAVLLAGLPASSLQVAVTDIPLFDLMADLNANERSVHEEGGYLAAKRLLANGLTARGVVCANDRVAMGFRQAAEEAKLIAGKDYALVGFDDIPEARSIGLSTMRPPLIELGQEAGRLLINALEGKLSSMQVCLHSHLIARASSRL